MRRSLGTNLQEHGTLKDAQGALRHASITTTGNVYMQIVDANVMRAVNSHAIAVLDGWTPEVESLGLQGRNVRKPLALTENTRTSDRNLTKFLERRFVCDCFIWLLR
jgi:hypothetical protein